MEEEGGERAPDGWFDRDDAQVSPDSRKKSAKKRKKQPPSGSNASSSSFFRMIEQGGMVLGSRSKKKKGGDVASFLRSQMESEKASGGGGLGGLGEMTSVAVLRQGPLEYMKERDARSAAIEGETKKRKAKGPKNKRRTVDPAELVSPVWTFFRRARPDENQEYVYCRAGECLGEDCRGKVKISNTPAGIPHLRSENAKSHVSRMHAAMWKAVEKAAQEGHDVAQTFDALMQAAGGKKTKQSTLAGVVHFKRPGQLEKELAFLVWLVRQKLPYNAVEDPSYNVMMQTFNVKLRKASSLKNLTFALHEVALRKAVAEIRDAKAYNITIDYWTAINGNQFLSITYHWTDENWNVRAQTLDLVPLNAAHTAELTAAAVQMRTDQKFRKWEACGEDLTAVTDAEAVEKI